jgi:uncharacterized protein YndB with AHSA1/START domain
MTTPVNFSDKYGRLEQTDFSSRIVFERILDHSPAKVWEAITVPEKISRWLSPNHPATETKIDLKHGGSVSLQLMMANIQGTITKLKSNTLLEIEFPGNIIMRWEISRINTTKCKLVFINEFPTGESVPADFLDAISGWHAYMDFLEITVNEGAISSFDPAEWNNISRSLNTTYRRLIT